MLKTINSIIAGSLILLSQLAAANNIEFYNAATNKVTVEIVDHRGDVLLEEEAPFGKSKFEVLAAELNYNYGIFVNGNALKDSKSNKKIAISYDEFITGDSIALEFTGKDKGKCSDKNSHGVKCIYY
ncbi:MULTISPECIES: hypothetical protein [Cysteiniphilum]|uniref:Uncharacterized protein n=1 Tax=Cysteiniphilum litorale TaxID=2056700 RepID=A0A8J3E7R9_9GAMM|nr:MULTISPECIES: hypothetical protein [Cysteiniphilum]GGF88880.1 hypothetical protein GCM10010995_02670 [Cysteiniphilum litorale]